MNKKISLVLMLGLMFASVAQAEPKKVEVTFSMSDNFDSVTFYVGNEKVCTVPKLELKFEEPHYVLTCDQVNIPVGWSSFSLTATVDGRESQHSPTVNWMKPIPESPIPGIQSLTFNEGATVIVVTPPDE